MHKAATIFVVSVIFGMFGCAHLPEHLDAEMGGIAICVKIRVPVKVFTLKPDRVYFVQLYEDNDSSFIQHTIIPSNLAKGGYFYLLNVTPGRYVAVATFRSQSRLLNNSPPTSSNLTISIPIEDRTYFSKEIVKLTEVTVKAGAIAFMGEFIVDQSHGLGDADEVQLHYHRLLVPEHERIGSFWRFIAGMYDYEGSLHRACQDKKAYDQFLEKARDHLAETGWSDALL